jgi:membrane-associated HD superfamily phosphohydrolase
MRTKELEVQYNLARYEREKKAAEAEAARSRRSDAQIQTFTKTETDLRQQLHVYVEKFKQVRPPLHFFFTTPTPSPAPHQHDQPVFHLQSNKPAILKVEDTLNNSNELFLTFRKEMEDMSRKTKRTEKENEGLKRKHDSMSSNIAKMAQDRTKHLQEIQDLKHKEGKLTNIINAMQQQGRSVVPSGATSSVPGGGVPEPVDATYVNGARHVDGDESDYDEYDDEDEEEGSEEVDGEEGYDDETEDELQHSQQQVQQPYGPERPPPAVTANGHA